MQKKRYKSSAFSSYTGKGVKIAVLDSGVNIYHSHIDKELTGQSFRVNREQLIETSANIRDYLGHGTAITAVLRYMASDATIVVGKIFDEKLASYPTVLAEAIHWAVDQKVHIINLSLGVKTDYDIVREACERALEHNIIIVAAVDRDSGYLWPGNYQDVFNISATEIGREHWEYNEEGHLTACGVPRELTGDIQLYNLHGHSFAAAHFTSWTARFLESKGSGGLAEVRDYIQSVTTGQLTEESK